MKLKTTAILACCGVLLSAAAALAIPVPSHRSQAAAPDPDGYELKPSEVREGSRVAAGDTLMLDARLGHASLAKGSRGETFLFAQVTAAEGAAGASVAPPMNLAVVIDRSGSMKGERIANAMNAAVTALERMRDGDTFTVVTFDTRADVIVPPTEVGARNRSSIEAAIRAIRLGGDTCISCGLEEGMRQLASAPLGGERITRMILLSDGVTNAGVRDIPGLRNMAGRMFGRGVTISTIGVDVDFDEKVMAAIAAEANGRHHFVANASSLAAVFSQEFDDLLASVAKEADLAIELAPGVEVEEVFDRSFRREGSRLIVPFGTFSGKQEKTVLVKLRVPAEHQGKQAVADVKLAYRDLLKRSDAAHDGALTLDVRADGSEQRDLDPFVAARLERSRTAQTLTDVNRLFEAGRVDEARARLASRRDELNRTSAIAVASAKTTAAPARPARSLDRDFADQLGAVAQAEASFAPPPAAAGPAADDRFPAQATRRGKASVRVNQQAASELGF